MCPFKLSSRTTTFNHFNYIPPLKAAKKTNPQLLDFCVCENITIAPEVLQRLEETRPAIDAQSFRYGDFSGEEPLRAAFARLLSEELCRGHAKWGAANVVVCGGLKSMTVMCAAACCEEGDGVLVISPCYPGFRRDLRVSYGGVEPIFVKSAAPDYRISIDALEEAFLVAQRSGMRVSAVVVTNPSNPIGRCYDREELEALLEWSDSKELSLWSDEIYGLSSREKGEEGFISMGEICAKARGRREGALGDNVVIWYGLSKDFGLSGMRVGCIVSDNLRLLASIANFNEFSSVPIPTQRQLVPLISDLCWVRLMMSTTAFRLHHLRTMLTSTLDDLRLKYAYPRGGGGMFMWVDLQPLLGGGEQDDGATVDETPRMVALDLKDEEWKLFEELLAAGIAIAPSSAFEAPDECYGYFRWCFAASGKAGLEAGLQRFRDFVGQRRSIYEKEV